MLKGDQLTGSPGFKFDGARANDPTVTADVLFLDAWERGLLTSLSAFLRARQIRRAYAARADGLTTFRVPPMNSAINRQPDGGTSDS
jgi:hypothetical protein